MPHQTRIVAPGPHERTVRTADGQVLEVPPSWELLPPGDAGLTRRVKAAGPTWTVQEQRGRKRFSRGVWAPADKIATIRRELAAERAAPGYAKRRETETARRQRKHADYVAGFRQAVFAFLNFAPAHAGVAQALADAVAAHATPVGSGTVARTQRISIERRAEAALIAWLRHQTTAYDKLKIPRIKGRRREIRRALAEGSRRALDAYRAGAPIDAGRCPIRQALARGSETGQCSTPTAS